MNGDASWTFILAAGGAGSRLGGTPKQFRLLGGRAVWTWSADIAEHLWQKGLIDELVVVMPERYAASSAWAGSCPVKFIAGGSERWESVQNGLAASSGRYVMIHDAARPFLDIHLCERLIESTVRVGAAMPVLQSQDSLKKIIDDDSVSVVKRDTIFRTQTPQCFERQRLCELIRSVSDVPTDEASVWIEAGDQIASVEGSEMAFKITTEFDWMTACALVNGRETRTGIGCDVHELVPGRRLVLGGVEIDCALGLLGHSDADVLTHAVSDALLGAAGLGDIGTLFPASDERYKDARSTDLLADVLSRLKHEGWSVVWVDAVLYAQVPRLGQSIPQIRTSLSDVMSSFGLADRISIKVKSGEYVGSVGRAQCMTCSAVATIERYAL